MAAQPEPVPLPVPESEPAVVYSTGPVPPLSPLNTTEIPEPKEQEIVSPPPAYFPNPLYRTGSWGAQAAINPSNQELQDQYTEYFTKLFTTWIEYGVVFYKYGLPVIKWSSLFFVRGLGGWREWFLLAGWFLVWAVPGLYLGILGKEIGDIAKGPNGEQQQISELRYRVLFWGAWGCTVIVKWGGLLFIMGLKGWWLRGAWLGWVCLFGI